MSDARDNPSSTPALPLIPGGQGGQQSPPESNPFLADGTRANADDSTVVMNSGGAAAMSSPPRRGAIIVDETPPAGSESTFNHSLTSVNADPSLLFSAGPGLARSAQGGAPLPVERVMVDSDDDVPFKAKSTMQFSRNYSVFSSKLPGVGLEIGGEKVEQEGRIGVRGNLGLPVPGIAGGGVKSDPEFSSTPKKKKESKAKTL